MEEQEVTGLNESTEISREETPLSNTLSSKEDDSSKREGIPELVREAATESAPTEQATQAAREDVLLSIETISSPEPLEADIPPDDVLADAEGAEAAPLGEEHTGAEQMDTASEAVSSGDLGPKVLESSARWRFLVVGLGIAAPAMLGFGSFALRRYRERRATSRKVTRRVARSLQRFARG